VNRIIGQDSPGGIARDNGKAAKAGRQAWVEERS
jgi:hypothetical protein